MTHVSYHLKLRSRQIYVMTANGKHVATVKKMDDGTFATKTVRGMTKLAPTYIYPSRTMKDAVERVRLNLDGAAVL